MMPRECPRTAGSRSMTLHHSPFLRAVASISAQHRVKPVARLVSRTDMDRDLYRLAAQESKLDMLAGFVAHRPSRIERLEAGKALRRKIPRSEHAAYRPSSRRSDPVEILQAQNATRIQSLVPVRMARMLASPFAFLRGSAAIM